MTLRARLALAALLALGPPGAAAQWRATPMVVPGAAGAEVLLGRFSAGATGDEILVVDRATGAGRLHAHRALLSTTAWPHALPQDTPLAAGRTRDANADPLADVAYGQGTNLVIRYGASPATAIPRAGLAPGGTSYVHALAHDGDLVAYPTAGIASGVGSLVFWDFATSAFGGTGTRTSWPANGLGPIAGAEHEVLGIRLSPAAAALGLEDLAMPTGGGVFLLAHAPATADARYGSPPLDPAELRLAEVRVGGPSALPRPPWLPASLPRKGDALGAAAVDVDGDGTRDLLFSYGSHLPIAGGGFPGRLVAIRGTGDVRQLASGTWEDLTAHPDLQLGDPAVLRPVVIGGQPAAALWDRGRDEIVVVFPGADAGRLAAWRGDAAGREVRDLRTADVVGSTAPDLVVVADDLLVYPDLGDASPALAWSGGSPPVPLRGQDLLLSASAADPDGACTVEWLVGPPGDAAVVASASVPGPAAQELAYQVAGAALCAPQTLSATVRATDALGVFDELSLSFEVAPTPLTLRVAGADRPGRLVLEPGGVTTVAFVATAATGCGDVAWGGVAWPPGTATDSEGPDWVRREVTVAEAAYPALLAQSAPAVSIATTDPAADPAAATLPLEIDGSALVEVIHDADRAALGSGELAILRTRLRSRIGVPLADVRVRDVLAGLAPAGAPAVTGGSVVALGAGGAEVVLASLPAAPAEVTIELPVRSTGEPGGSAVEARSSAGWLLTPAAPAGAADAALPGCGCGAAGAPDVLAVVALALAAALRRRRAT